MIHAALLLVLVLVAAKAMAAQTAPAASTTAPDWSSWTDDEQGQALDPQFVDEPDQEPDPFETILIQMDPSTYIPANVTPDRAAVNMRATLDTIAYCEGTLNARGYQTMFGYRYFDSYADHPRQYWPFTDGAGRELYSSAAGRYQIIVKTWDSLRARLQLPDFSPASQDAAAIELIRERGALEDAYAGRIATVASKCRRVWASLPGAGYAQPERSVPQVIAAFQNAGGTLA